jgi:predicted protein tyrosine phosphatase
MFKWKVDGLTGAEAYLDRNHWPTKAVSLVSPKYKGWKSRGPHHIVIYIDDIGSEMPDYIAPQFSHVEQVLEFTWDLTDADKLLVHCHLGQSRSTAMMMGILYQHGMEPQAAFDAVKEQRPFLLPNVMICQHIDRYYELPGTFEGIARARYSPEELALRRQEMLGTGQPGATTVDAMQTIINRLKGTGDL